MVSNCLLLNTCLWRLDICISDQHCVCPFFSFAGIVIVIKGEKIWLIFSKHQMHFYTVHYSLPSPVQFILAQSEIRRGPHLHMYTEMFKVDNVAALLHGISLILGINLDRVDCLTFYFNNLYSILLSTRYIEITRAALKKCIYKISIIWKKKSIESITEQSKLKTNT